jgi:hypothetical protein
VVERIQLRRTKGWRIPENTVVVSRPSKWGNPFDFRKSEFCWAALSFGCRGDRIGRQEASVRAFRDWIDPRWGRRTLGMEEQPHLCGPEGERLNLGPAVKAGAAPSKADIVKELRGKNLACWCKLGEPCHADVLLEIANRPHPIERRNIDAKDAA